MGRGRSPRRPAGGGGGIQALRQARARLILASGSTLVYSGVLVYAVLRAGYLGGLTAAVGALGGVFLGAVLVRGIHELLSWSLGVLGSAYCISIAVHRGSLDEATPLVAAALLLCGELAAWSLDERVRIESEPGTVVRRATAVTVVVGAGLAAAAAVIAVAAAPAGRGLAWTTLGAASAVCAVGLAVAVARRAG